MTTKDKLGEIAKFAGVFAIIGLFVLILAAA
jgi:hypothetical protein